MKVLAGMIRPIVIVTIIVHSAKDRPLDGRTLFKDSGHESIWLELMLRLVELSGPHRLG
jgi:hypothetical protein